HRTDGCKSFKSHLENLVREGHLRDYLKEEGRDSSRPPRRDDGSQDSEPEGIINVIHIAPPPKGSSQARAEARRASHQKHVLTAAPEPAAKKAKTEGHRIWFSDRDLEDIELPHNDPLVLTLKLQNFLVQRVLVDPLKALFQ
ncbi:hypothetical protein, partial [Corallococcus interemptor]|uniref:hypothetical protein n=1 Tax=Corallococcus interemptor TaxID=2316720 RepID=UPI001ABFFAF3